MTTRSTLADLIFRAVDAMPEGTRYTLSGDQLLQTIILAEFVRRWEANPS